jgi:hypothetical protein
MRRKCTAMLIQFKFQIALQRYYYKHVLVRISIDYMIEERLFAHPCSSVLRKLANKVHSPCSKNDRIKTSLSRKMSAAMLSPSRPLRYAAIVVLCRVEGAVATYTLL